MYVAGRIELVCWLGCGERWGATWWDHQSHLSPINSLYLSPCVCTVTTRPHRTAVWRLHLTPRVLRLMKKVFYRLLVLFISFPDTGEPLQQPPLWYDEQPLCLPILLFWFCSIIYFSSFSLVIQKSKEKEESSATKRKHFCMKNSCWVFPDGIIVVLVKFAATRGRAVLRLFIKYMSSFLNMNMLMCQTFIIVNEWPCLQNKSDTLSELWLDEHS